MIKVNIILFGKFERVIKMKAVPRIGEKISINAVLYPIRDVWWNDGQNPELKFDVRILLTNPL